MDRSLRRVGQYETKLHKITLKFIHDILDIETIQIQFTFIFLLLYLLKDKVSRAIIFEIYP